MVATQAVPQVENEQAPDAVQQSNKDNTIISSALTNKTTLNLSNANNQSQEIVTLETIRNPNSSIIWLKMTEKSGNLKNTPTKPVFKKRDDLVEGLGIENGPGQVISSSSLILRRRERRRK